MHWIGIFLIAATALVWAGITLARAGDEIATRTGLGVGDLFGSNMANMAILAVIDLIARRKVWLSVELGHARVASVAVALTALAVLGIVTPVGVSVGWVGLDTIGIAAAYLLAVAWVRRTRSRVPENGTRPGSAAGSDRMGPVGTRIAELRGAALRFALAAGVVLVSGPFVAISGKGGPTRPASVRPSWAWRCLRPRRPSRAEGPAEAGSSASRVEAVPVRI